LGSDATGPISGSKSQGQGFWGRSELLAGPALALSVVDISISALANG